MVNNITTRALVDYMGAYHAGGCEMSVRADADVRGEVYIATDAYDGYCTQFPSVDAGQIVEASHPVTKVLALEVWDLIKGQLFLAETQVSYGEKINACCIAA